MMFPDGAAEGPVLQEATRELEAAIHDARVAFDCIGLGEIDRAHTSAVTARIAIDAAVTAVQAALAQSAEADADPWVHLYRLVRENNVLTANRFAASGQP
jgi:hypothetical protein